MNEMYRIPQISHFERIVRTGCYVAMFAGVIMVSIGMHSCHKQRLAVYQPVVLVNQTKCLQCHFTKAHGAYSTSAAVPIIRTVGEYRRLKQHKPKSQRDRDIAEEMENQEYLIQQMMK